MLLIQRELSEKTHLKSELDFPLIINRPSHLVYTFPDAHVIGKNSYIFELFEYFKTKPVIKKKLTGKWTKGQSFGFDLIKDYFIKEGIRYALKTTIYIQNNREIYDVIFIQI